MKLSVVMAARDGEAYLRDAIESVLAQSVTDFEFIVVDDGSRDDTAGILAEYLRRDSRIRVLTNASSLGPYPAVNRALQDARADIVVRQDADDVSPPDRFAMQLDAFGPDVSLVTGAIEIVDAHSRHAGWIRPPSWQPRLEWELLFSNAVGAGAHVMFPRAVGGVPIRFPEKYAYAHDYGLWCALARRGRVACPTGVVYRYRRHDLAISTRRKTEQTECFSRLRHDYQSIYSPRIESREVSDALARFWDGDGNQVLTHDVGDLMSVFRRLKANFLEYIEGRWGRSERARLEADIDLILDRQIGFWLLRSFRRLDRRSCGGWWSQAIGSRRALAGAGRAVQLTASAALRRLWPGPQPQS